MSNTHKRSDFPDGGVVAKFRSQMGHTVYVRPIRGESARQAIIRHLVADGHAEFILDELVKQGTVEVMEETSHV